MTPLTYFQLETHLAKSIAPIYILSGDEIFLKQDALHTIRKAARKAGFSERTRLLPEAGFDWDQLYTLLFSPSLLAEKQIIEIDFRDISPPKGAHKILEEYAKNPTQKNLLLVDMGKVEQKTAKTTWYQALQKNAVVVTIWPLSQEQLPQWIMNRAKKYKIACTAAIAELIADYAEGNLIAAAQAIEKIVLHQPQSITEELIHSILIDESRFTIFDFVENLIAGNKTKTLHVLSTLKVEGTEPVLILWGITRELRLLADYAQKLQQGLTLDAVLSKQRIFSRRKGAIQKFLAQHKTEDCWHYLSEAAHLDKIIKGAESGQIWQDLELFCLKVTQHKV